MGKDWKKESREKVDKAIKNGNFAVHKYEGRHKGSWTSENLAILRKLREGLPNKNKEANAE